MEKEKNNFKTYLAASNDVLNGYYDKKGKYNYVMIDHREGTNYSIDHVKSLLNMPMAQQTINSVNQKLVFVLDTSVPAVSSNLIKNFCIVQPKGTLEGSSVVPDSTVSAQETAMRNELIANHELNHCRFAEFKDPFKMFGNTKLNKEMNLLYETVGMGEGVKAKLNEGYADTMAAMQLLKAYNSNQESKNTLYRFVALRQEDALKMESFGLKSQYSDVENSLKMLLSEEGLKRLEKIPATDQGALESYALELANKGLLMGLVKRYQNGNLERLPAFRPSAEYLVRNILDTYPNEFDRKGFKWELFKDTGANIYGGGENNLSYKLATYHISEMEKDGSLSKFKAVLKDFTALRIPGNNATPKEVDEFFDKLDDGKKKILDYTYVLNDKIQSKGFIKNFTGIDFDNQKFASNFKKQLSSYRLSDVSNVINEKGQVDNKKVEQALDKIKASLSESTGKQNLEISQKFLADMEKINKLQKDFNNQAMLGSETKTTLKR